MQETVTKCDVCKKPRREANHWWRGRVAVQRFQVPAVIIIPATAKGRSPEDADLCGRECCHKWTDAQLDRISNERGH